MIRAACAALLLWTAGVASAQSPAPAEPEGAPVAGEVLRDADFGVSTRLFGLERRVEMYQWRRDGGRYERAWSAGLIDSTGFADGRANPAAMPLAGRRWWSQDATLDGRPLSPEVLRALGRWREFRPGFSRLPANLAATFQPDGDGLSSSENPLDPQVGDLRVTWRELVLPPLAGRIELHDGAWRLRADATERTADDDGDVIAAPAAERLAPPSGRGGWTMFGLLGAIALSAMAWWALRRRRARRDRGHRA
ncbi:hypothetical protein SD81_017335 [Tolypothrix campylonemoides VB511288]|nr:hypothetical protein SD81_017335 [Tolypothrix campylonemoides VB511288]